MAAIDFPNSPTLNQTFTVGNKTWQWNGSYWNSAETPARYFVSDTAPSNPSANDLWFNSTTAKTYMFYDGFWVDQTSSVLNVGNASASSAGLVSTGTQTFAGDKTFSGSFTAANYSMAGKNVIINGGMDFWQRGNGPFTAVSSGTYTADRWQIISPTVTATITKDSSTPTALYLASIKAMPTGSVTAAEFALRQQIETQQLLQLAGSMVIASAWVKSSKANNKIRLSAYGATGGTDITVNITVTPGVWTYVTASLTSLIAATAWTTAINGAAANFDIGFANSTAVTASDYIQLAGVQLERGSIATPFSRAGGTIAGELAACQRYYWRSTTANNAIHCVMVPQNGANARGVITFPVTMRTVVGSIETNGSPGDYILDGMGGDASYAATGIAPVTSWYNNNNMWLSVNVSSGLTAWHTYFLRNQTSTAYLAFNAEF